MATKWFCKLRGATVGPMSADELLKKVRSGDVNSATMIRKDDSTWFPAEEVDGLFEAAFKDQPGRYVKEPDTEYSGD